MGLTEVELHQRRLEAQIVAPYRGRFEWRAIATFVIFAVAWVAVLVAGLLGTIPIWVGFIVNTLLATTFYMPMHEAAHRNLWGTLSTARWGEDLIGAACSIPLGFDFFSHRSAHMRHHAHTNVPDRDPDHYTHGSVGALVVKWFGVITVLAFLPVFGIVPKARQILPAQVRDSLEVDIGGTRAQRSLLYYWFISHAALAVSFALGAGVPLLALWYLPSRLSGLWLLVVFAWYPHHPATQVGRYVDTRVAVFPGSTLLIRGHDYHALHHLYPRVPHYRLPGLWEELADDLVAKGVRSQGRAKAADGPIEWR